MRGEDEVVRIWYALRAWIEGLVFRGREERALREEVRFHLEMEAGKLRAAGLSEADARREARLRFGGEERMKERVRQARGSRWLEDLVVDLRFGLRGLRRAPAFTFTVLATLALGTGAATAMVTLVQGVVFRPLPHPDPDRLVSVREVTPEGRSRLASYLNFADWRAQVTSFEGLAAVVPPVPVTVLVGDVGVRASVAQVSADFFPLFGVRPDMGRTLDPADHRPGAPAVAVVSHRFWLEVLGGDLDPTERPLAAGGEPVPVVGVLPPSFDEPAGTDVWISLDRAVPWNVRGNAVVEVVGRLAPGVDAARAREELAAVHARLRTAYAEVDTGDPRMTDLRESLVGGARRPLLLLVGAAALLLGVAAANVGGAFLARGIGRGQELAVRASLGAGRGRLARQLVGEAGLAGGLAGAASLVVAWLLVGIVRNSAGTSVPRLAEVALDLRVVVGGVLLGVATGVLFGLLPAWRLAGGMGNVLRTGSRAGRSPSARLLWRGLMGSEVALSLVLLVGAALLGRSMLAVVGQDLGFDPEGVVTARFHLPQARYDGSAAIAEGVDRLLEAVRERPEVAAAGLALFVPIQGGSRIAGPVETDDGRRPEAVFHYQVADAGVFEALGVTLVRGRLFDASDRPETGHVALVDESMARLLWPDEDPVGKRFTNRGMDPWPEEPLTVVGVVSDVRTFAEGWGDSRTYYVAHRQRPAFVALFGGEIVVRASERGPVIDAVRSAVRSADPSVPLVVEPLERRLRMSAGERRLAALVFGGFAGAALLLACVGLHGLVAYGATNRRREMALRMALGAGGGEVRRRLQGEVLGAVGWGAAIGLILALLLARSLRTLLFGVAALDPASLALAAVALAGAAWGASWLPARRAARASPARVLREE